jgi:hypothetical protein
METRRIRRLERRRSQRIIATAVALGAVGVAVGLALPRNPTASALTLVLAVGALAAIALRADSAAPSHGLRHVVRLPIRSAVSASVASLSSRVVGTFRVIWRSTPSAVPDAKPDSDAQAWWATRPDPGTEAASLAPAPSEPERTEHAPAGVRREIERIRGSFARRLGARRMPGDRETSDALEGSTVSTSSS